jgi:nickel transport protein
MRLALLLVLVSAPSSPVQAHGLHYDVTAGEVITIHFTYADALHVAFENYEVYRPGEETPFQVGRTDALGRLVFIPDRKGQWRVRVFTADGHGADLTVAAEAAGQTVVAGRSLFERYLHLAVGIAIILGLFGILKLFVRKSPGGPE